MNPTNPQQLEIVGTEKTEQESLNKFRLAIHDFKTSLQSAKDRYYGMIMVIRTEQIAPKQARKELADAGFEKGNISTILRVALGTLEIYEEYTRREISLQIAAVKNRDKDRPEESKGQSERKKFESSLTRLMEQYLPVAGVWPSYLHPDKKREKQGTRTGYITIKIHGQVVAIRIEESDATKK